MFYSARQTVDLSQQHMPFNVIEDTEPIEPPPGSQMSVACVGACL